MISFNYINTKKLSLQIHNKLKSFVPLNNTKTDIKLFFTNLYLINLKKIRILNTKSNQKSIKLNLKSFVKKT